jgi:hypothetical protein
MKVLLLNPEGPFDPEATPPPNAKELIQDLELTTLIGSCTRSLRRRSSAVSPSPIRR